MNEIDDLQPMPSEAEIEERFEAIKAKLDPITQNPELDRRTEEFLSTQESQLEPIPDPESEKMAELQKRANALKQKRDNQVRQQTKETRAVMESNAGLGAGLAIAYTIIGIPVLGGIVGVVLKSQTGNPAWVTAFGLAGMVLGLVGAYFVALRTRR